MPVQLRRQTDEAHFNRRRTQNERDGIWCERSVEPHVDSLFCVLLRLLRLSELDLEIAQVEKFHFGKWPDETRSYFPQALKASRRTLAAGFSVPSARMRPKCDSLGFVIG